MSLDLYREYRPHLQDGDVLEWGSDGLIGKIIQHGTKSDVSHTSGVAWWHGRVFTLEAAGLSFHPTHLSNYMEKCNKRVYWLQLMPEYDSKRKQIAETLIDMSGTPYDNESLIASLWRRVRNDESKLFCSEAIGIALEKAGVIPKQVQALWPGEFERLGVFFPRIRIF